MVSLPTPRYAYNSFNVDHFSMFPLLNSIYFSTFLTIYFLPLRLRSAPRCNSREFTTSVIELDCIVGDAVNGFLVKGISSSCRFKHINHKVVLISDPIASFVYALVKYLKSMRVTSSEKSPTISPESHFN